MKISALTCCSRICLSGRSCQVICIHPPDMRFLRKWPDHPEDQTLLPNFHHISVDHTEIEPRSFHCRHILYHEATGSPICPVQRQGRDDWETGSQILATEHHQSCTQHFPLWTENLYGLFLGKDFWRQRDFCKGCRVLLSYQLHVWTVWWLMAFSRTLHNWNI